MHNYRQMGIATQSPSLSSIHSLLGILYSPVPAPYPYNITTPESTPVLAKLSTSGSIERERKRKEKRKFVHREERKQGPCTRNHDSLVIHDMEQNR